MAKETLGDKFRFFTTKTYKDQGSCYIFCNLLRAFVMRGPTCAALRLPSSYERLFFITHLGIAFLNAVRYLLPNWWS
jgi:hypothetical protein